ncbi:MAG TPA: hypothetical protein VK425_11180 [Acidimicrobiales bacterium]|nr:hypothetical protein [Acidimicrobiales bacterium]
MTSIWTGCTTWWSSVREQKAQAAFMGWAPELGPAALQNAPNEKLRSNP